MAQLTISEAIRQSPVGRTTFYTKYIDNGVISISVDNDGKKTIDSSELVRVFGDKLKTGGNEQDERGRSDTAQQNTNTLVQHDESLLVVQLRTQIEDLKADKEYQRTQIATLTARLEPPTPDAAIKQQSRISKWWYGLD